MKKIAKKSSYLILCTVLCCALVSCSLGNIGSSLPQNNQSNPTSAYSSAQPKKEGTRLNPIQVGSAAIYDGMDNTFYDYKVELTVTETIRGKDAWSIVKKGNMFNDKPESGKEYILVKFKIKTLESADDKKIDLNNSNFTFVSATGTTYNDFVVISGVEPELTDMYAGAEAEGYVYELINEGDAPLVVFHEGFDGEIWFATE